MRNSAEIVQPGRITRRGSRSLRWILTECVHSHVRYARDSYITNCYNRIAKKRGFDRLADMPRSGRPTMVSKADLKRIRKNACRKTVWTGREMQEYIQQQTGVKYNLIHVRYIRAFEKILGSRHEFSIIWEGSLFS